MKSLSALLCLLFVGAAQAATLEFRGVLANSGETGSTLVLFGDKPAPGMGVVCDRFGSLWDRGGSGVLNRYAPDGRLVAQYRIPSNGGNRDQIAISGDMILLLVGGKLFALKDDAPLGAEAISLKIDAECMSPSTLKGAVALFNKGEVTLFNPADGSRTPLLSTPKAQMLEFDSAGALYVQADGLIQKFVDGKAVTDGWPKKSSGDRLQFTSGYFYSNAWHGTTKRFDANFEPQPGVVLGGMSGHFIGKLEQLSEIWQGRGIAQVRENLFAISGHQGVLHLLEWDGSTRQMNVARRIGALSSADGLALDGKGKVWCNTGSWNWSDGPDAPQRWGINIPENVGQAALVGDDNLVAAGSMWSQPAIYSGDMGDSLRIERIEKNLTLPKPVVASVSYKIPGQHFLIALGAHGKGQTVAIGGDGRFQKDAGPTQFKLKTPGSITSLAKKSDEILLAAANGAIVEFKRDGSDWTETERWPAGEGDEAFGANIFVCAHAGKLWVSDTQKSRVLAFDLASRKKLAQYGVHGKDLQQLRYPGPIASYGSRACVFDAGNQRLVKLELRD